MEKITSQLTDVIKGISELGIGLIAPLVSLLKLSSAKVLFLAPV